MIHRAKVGHSSRASGQLATHQLRLLDKRGGVLAHVVDDVHGRAAAEGGLALAGDQQGIHERLRVVPPDADQQAVDQTAHDRLRRVDACDDLRATQQHCLIFCAVRDGHRSKSRTASGMLLCCYL